MISYPPIYVYTFDYVSILPTVQVYPAICSPQRTESVVRLTSFLTEVTSGKVAWLEIKTQEKSRPVSGLVDDFGVIYRLPCNPSFTIQFSVPPGCSKLAQRSS
jgi:hypothetical protein